MPRIVYGDAWPLYRHPHITRESVSVDGRSCWGYRLTCTLCGEVEESITNSSVTYEDAPGRFGYAHRDCPAERRLEAGFAAWRAVHTIGCVPRGLSHGTLVDTGFVHGPDLPALDDPRVPASYRGPLLQEDGESRAYRPTFRRAASGER